MPIALFLNATVLEVSGRDAQRYLNARLSNDIKKLAPGAGCLAAALTPQGRTQALFAVYRLDAERTLLQCDGGEREMVIAAFKKYLVADQVKVLDRSDELGVAHLSGESPATLEQFLGTSISQEQGSMAPLQLNSGHFVGGLLVRRLRFLQDGLDLIAARSALQQVTSSTTLELLPPSNQLVLRIQASIPAFPEELNEEALFSEAGYREAVAFNKGCYVGQEVVEKVDALGKTARVLRRPMPGVDRARRSGCAQRRPSGPSNER